MKNRNLIALNTLKLVFNKKTNIIIFIIIPIISIILSMGTNYARYPLNVGICNKDNGIISKDMIKTLKINKKINIKYYENCEDIDKDIYSEKTHCVIIFPEGFSNKAYENKIEYIKIRSLKKEESTEWIKNFINFYMGNVCSISNLANGNKEVFNNIYKSFKNGELKLYINTIEDENGDKNVVYSSMGFLVMCMMIGCSNITSLIIREKQNRAYYRILVSPTSNKDYIFGNIIANLIMIIFQVSIVIFIMDKIFKVNFFMPIYQVFLILMCMGFIAITFGVMLISFCKNSNEVGNLLTFTITPMCMLSGCFWPVYIMPKFMQKISYLFPQRWVLLTIENIQKGKTFYSQTLNMLIILSFALVYTLIGIYNFKNKDSVQKFI